MTRVSFNDSKTSEKQLSIDVPLEKLQKKYCDKIQYNFPEELFYSPAKRGEETPSQSESDVSITIEFINDEPACQRVESMVQSHATFDKKPKY